MGIVNADVTYPRLIKIPRRQRVCKNVKVNDRAGRDTAPETSF